LMVESVLVDWILTAAFAVTGLWFLFGRALFRAGSPAAGIGDRISDVAHALTCAVMIAMTWPWGVYVPAWPQVTALIVATGWFLVMGANPGWRSASHARGMRRLPHLHHALMAAAVIWMIVVLPASVSMGGSEPRVGSPAALFSDMPANPADASDAVMFVGVVLAAYFLLAALPWCAAAVGIGRRAADPAVTSREELPGAVKRVIERGASSHWAFDAASHAAMSLGMSVLLLGML
jgi:hypothetical protein